nr:Chain C, MP-2 [synthetic construct]1HXZ_D Chain D, MP-2 [synthetic construct]
RCCHPQCGMVEECR